MGKVNFQFIDEDGNNLNQFRMLNKDTSETIVIQLFREANITQVGTPLNSGNMNALISAINGNADDIEELNGKKYTHNICFSYTTNAVISFTLFSNSNTPFTTLEEVYNAMVENKRIVASGTARIADENGNYILVPIYSVKKTSTGIGYNYMALDSTTTGQLISSGNFSIIEIEDSVI